MKKGGFEKKRRDMLKDRYALCSRACSGSYCKGTNKDKKEGARYGSMG